MGRGLEGGAAMVWPKKSVGRGWRGGVLRVWWLEEGLAGGGVVWLGWRGWLEEGSDFPISNFQLVCPDLPSPLSECKPHLPRKFKLNLRNALGKAEQSPWKCREQAVKTPYNHQGNCETHLKYCETYWH